MKKTLIILLSLLLSFALTGCSQTADNTNSNQSLYEQGLELIALMEEMADSETYFTIFSNNKELQEVVSVICEGDYTSPKAVYQISIPEDQILSISEDAVDDLSEPLKDYVTSKIYSTVASQINAVSGVNILAASSIYTAGKTFINNEFTGNTIYLYTYENAVPVIITFTAGEDNIVSASGSFICGNDFKADTLEDVDKYFAKYSASVDILEQ